MRLRVPVLFVLLAWTSPVLAWSDAGRCNIGAAFPPSGEIPANIPALVVPSYGSDPTLLSFVLVAEDGTETLVEATERESTSPLGHAFLPTAPLTVGAQYRIHVGPCLIESGVPGYTFDYTVVAPLSTPVDLGLTLSPLRRRFWPGEAGAADDVTRFSVDATFERTGERSAAERAWLSLYELDWSATTPTSGTTSPAGFDVLGVRREIEIACPTSTSTLRALPEGDLRVNVLATSSVAPTLEDSASTTTVCADAIDVPTTTPEVDAGSGDAGVTDAGRTDGVPPAACAASAGSRSASDGARALSLLLLALLFTRAKRRAGRPSSRS